MIGKSYRSNYKIVLNLDLGENIMSLLVLVGQD